jgi:hypothetical protein
MEMRIKREETRRSITVLFVTLNKKTLNEYKVKKA